MSDKLWLVSTCLPDRQHGTVLWLWSRKLWVLNRHKDPLIVYLLVSKHLCTKYMLVGKLWQLCLNFDLKTENLWWPTLFHFATLCMIINCFLGTGKTVLLQAVEIWAYQVRSRWFLIQNTGHIFSTKLKDSSRLIVKLCSCLHPSRSVVLSSSNLGHQRSNVPFYAEQLEISRGQVNFCFTEKKYEKNILRKTATLILVSPYCW